MVCSINLFFFSVAREIYLISSGDSVAVLKECQFGRNCALENILITSDFEQHFSYLCPVTEGVV
ncbi:hypothetical protein MUK42_24238 [Musa troglodytarum]|uniref:Uncharacterized protein n=1 Tax=Musa troglodytarum TaxID=320322 RepID=A0A9E7FKW6_9LILI|nr:hypothetical protein MUK42_24238 [Musa troglodytarum]